MNKESKRTNLIPIYRCLDCGRKFTTIEFQVNMGFCPFCDSSNVKDTNGKVDITKPNPYIREG
jgi:rRNA maturation endonuclease Nob1